MDKRLRIQVGFVFLFLWASRLFMPSGMAATQGTKDSDRWAKVEAAELAMPSPAERVAHFSKILMNHDDPSIRSMAWLGLGQAHEAARQDQEACTAYGHYVLLEERDSRGWEKLALVAERLQRWETATSAWQKVTVLTDGQASKEAISKTTVARLMADLNKRPGDAKAMVALGEAYAASARHDQARMWFKSGMEANPTDMKAWWGYGVSCQEIGQLDESSLVWQKMLALPLAAEWRSRVARKASEIAVLQHLAEVEDPEGMFKLAGMYYSSENPGKALLWIDKALAKEKRPNWLRARALSLENLDRWPEAADSWRDYAALETDEKAVREGVAHWATSMAEWVRQMRTQGKHAECLALLQGLKQNPDFPSDLAASLREDVLSSMLAFADDFTLGNVDVGWNRERGSWVINRTQLEGSDGRLWTRKRFQGPVMATVTVRVDPQYPGRPGIAVCSDPEGNSTAGCWFVFGDRKAPARLYRPGKSFQDIPELIAPAGEEMELEIRTTERSVSILCNGEIISSLDLVSPVIDISKPYAIGLIADSGVVTFDNLRVYRIQ